jgi:hypothetical protein
LSGLRLIVIVASRLIIPSTRLVFHRSDYDSLNDGVG